MPQRARLAATAALPRLVLLLTALAAMRVTPGSMAITRDGGGERATPRYRHWRTQSPPQIATSLETATATAAASSLQRRVRPWWGDFPSRCRRCSNARCGGDTSTSTAAAAAAAAAIASPSWVRVRGGASTRVDGRSPDGDVSDCGEGDGAGLEEDVGEAATSEEQEDEDKREEVDSNGGEADSDKNADSTKGGEAAATESLAATMQLGEVLPSAIKTGVAFVTGTWLAKKMSPGVEGHVRAARVIYTMYLIFSQALCMYIRYLIWKKDDNTPVEVPPPPQLKSMIDGIGGTAAAAAGGGDADEAGGAAGAASAASGAASSLAPMLDKMLTSKTPAKKYDMKVVQGIRRGQFWASLFMCYTHLKRGMINPMILQVSFGILSLLDSPLFKIYVLGKEAEGRLARPFKKQGLMASISGPMEGMAAKAEEARAAAEAVQAAVGKATGDGSDDESSGDDDDGDNGEGFSTEAGGVSADEGENVDAQMPDIEDLTESEESD